MFLHLQTAEKSLKLDLWSLDNFRFINQKHCNVNGAKYLSLPRRPNQVQISLIIYFDVGIGQITCKLDRREALKSLCLGEKGCQFVVVRQTFGNGCRYSLKLEITYECLPCDQKQVSLRHRRGLT